MPKIIENLKDRLLAEAKRQLKQGDYEELTIRSIAKGCGVGVGTVYNYFPSKEALIATYLLEDWQVRLDTVQTVADQADVPEQVIRCMYEQLVEFARCHQAIFNAATAQTGFAGAFSQYHQLLRAQIAGPLRRFCSSEFDAQFVAEGLLTWAMNGKAFDEIYRILKKLF